VQMYIIQRTQRFLRGFLLSYGPEAVKQWFWDSEFRSGKWNFIDNTASDCVYPYLETYAKNGNILDLGCGPGNTATELAANAYRTYVGVDISAAALAKAAGRTEACGRTGKNYFVRADFLGYEPTEKFNVVLFRESLYHVPVGQVRPILARYSRHLTSDGVFVVRIFLAERGKPKYRLAMMMRRIEKDYEIVEKRQHGDSGATVVVFRPKAYVTSGPAPSKVTLDEHIAPVAAGQRGSESNVSVGMKNIAVCICTYRRPAHLKRLLESLMSQNTDGLFTYSIVVADNDHLRSGEAVVSLFRGAPVPIQYCVEPRQNIALARNKAIENASGDFIAFIDDDEFPTRGWLLTLFDTLNEYRMDGVLGPVKRHFDEAPPEWLLKSNFYKRVVYPTGTTLDREEGRTGNVLLKRQLFNGQAQPFKPELRVGEDKDFFRRMIDSGYQFIWSAEAVVFETVPSVRWKRSFMLKRALFRGAHVPLHPNFGLRRVMRSLVAVPTYSLMLPVALLLGQHRFMTLLVKLCDHLGLLLALIGVNRLHEAYITE